MSTVKNRIDTDVLVVGAGPAGGALSALLGSYGVDNVMINLFGSTSPTPRAHITNQRAMEILRDLNVEEEAKALSVPQEIMGQIVYCENLAGEEFGRLLQAHSHPRNKADHDLASPSAICDLPQTLLEPILLKAAMRNDSKVRFHTEFRSLEQFNDGVHALCFDHLTQSEVEIRCRYLVGADGGKSRVAEQIGLPFEGAIGLGGSINIHFEADLTHLTKHRPADMYWIFRPGTGVGGHGFGVLRMIHPWNQWVAVWGFDIAEGEPDITDDMALDIVQSLVGTPDIEIRLGSYNTWTINRQFATRVMKDRVLCIGDAIHRHPPTNGLGSNTSIADSYNLAWKLKAVLGQEAGPQLLATYQDERGPIARQIVERAFASMGLIPPVLGALGITPDLPSETANANAAARKAIGPEAADQRRRLREAIRGTNYIFNTLGVELNQRYVSDAIATDQDDEGADFARDPELHYQPSSRPGAHLPHSWLVQDQRKVSTLDLCGRGKFTLLTGLCNADEWEAACKRAREATGAALRLHIVGPGREFEDPYGEFHELLEIEEGGALLVRPDMFVAWRSVTGKESAALPEVFSRVLCRPDSRTSAADTLLAAASK